MKEHPRLALMYVDECDTAYFASLHVERRGAFIDFKVVARSVAGRVLCRGTIDPESIADLVAYLGGTP